MEITLVKLKLIFAGLLIISMGAVAFVATMDLFQLKKTVLPKHVKSSEGEITLVADYKTKREDGKFSVYLINESGKEIKLQAQDGDVYLKL